MYLAMKESPELRAVSTLAAINWLDLKLLRSWASRVRSESCSRRRSSADPPNGLKAMMAAARFAASSTPMMMRITRRGSRRLMGLPLELLRIRNPYAGAEHRLGLFRHIVANEFDVAENRRFGECFQKVEDGQLGVGRKHHVERYMVLRIESGMHLHDLDVVRDGFFQVGENLGPTDAFSHQQRVDKDAALEHF